MPTTDTNVPQVVVNKLTKAQYEAATKSPTEFYVVSDEQIGTSDIADGAVTGAGNSDTTLADSNSKVALATIGTPNLRDNAVTSQKIDFSTVNFPDGIAQIIGSYTDSNNVTHNIYKKILKKTDYTTTANDPYKQYTVDLASYTILSTELSLYRTDSPAVINTTGKDLEGIYIGSGDHLRVYYHGGPTQTNATIYITITYMD